MSLAVMEKDAYYTVGVGKVPFEVNWEDILPVAGDIVGILSFAFSLAVFFRTGSIKKTLINNIDMQNKWKAYERSREQIFEELSMCCSFFTNFEGELAFDKAQPYIVRIDQSLTDMKMLHPSLTKQDKGAIDRLLKYIAGTHETQMFSYLEVMGDLHHLLSILKKEVLLNV